MALDRQQRSVQDQIQQFAGPYIGYVKNPTDQNRMGRLGVYIPDIHGAYDETNKDIGA